MSVRAETRARALAVQLLYAWDVPDSSNGRAPDERFAHLVAWRGAAPGIAAHARALAQGVVARCAELDAHIARAAQRWRLERLGVVDRNVLRLAAFELVSGDVPPKVAIDEAVRLARWFGGDRSPGFVNGVLDRLARDLGRL